jgi:hypothetical protein
MKCHHHCTAALLLLALALSVFTSVAMAFVVPTSSSTMTTAKTTATMTTKTTTATASRQQLSLRLQLAAAADAVSDASDDSNNTGALQAGDPVLLVGPGFLQLVLSRHLFQAGLRPIIVASQSQLDSFFQNLLKRDVIPPTEYDQLLQDSTIGMPELTDPYFGELKGVVFCAEDAVLPPEFVNRVLDFEDGGRSAWADGAPTRVICALPVSNKIQKEKSNSWIPIFNMDKKQDETWKKFEDAYKSHKCMSSRRGQGSIVRFGSLFGGSTDGPDELKRYGLDEGMYKVSQAVPR